MDKYKSLWHVFWGICVFKKGPQDVLHLGALTRFAFTAYVLAGMVVFMSSNAIDLAVMVSLVEAGVLTGFVYVLLRFFAVPERFTQTMTALYGCGAMATLLSAPLIYFIDASVGQEESAGGARLLLIVVVFWSYTVMAYILHKATEKSLGISMLITFCYLYLSYQLIKMIFPDSL